MKSKFNSEGRLKQRSVSIQLAVFAALWGYSAVQADVTGEWRVNLLKGTTTQETVVAPSQQEAWDLCKSKIPTSAATPTTYTCQTPRYVASVTLDPLQAPTLTAVATSPTSIQVDWTAVPGAVAYQLDKCVGAGCTNFTLAVCTDQLTSLRSGNANTTYQYRVRSSRSATCASDFSVYSPILSITTPPPTPSGVAVLSWTPPTKNTDGSDLTDLAGYRIVYGQVQTDLPFTKQVNDPAATTYTIEGLSTGIWYFGVKAFSATGAESDVSNIATKVIQ